MEKKRGKLRELLRSLEERLEEHDNNRKEVQSRLKTVCSGMMSEADSLEDKIGEEIRNDFKKKEDGILGLIERLKRRDEGNGDLDTLEKEAQDALSTRYEYGIKQSGPTNSFIESYNLVVKRAKENTRFNNIVNNIEMGISKLQEHMDKLHNSMKLAQEKLSGICEKRRAEADQLEKRINEELERSFMKGDKDIQEVVNSVKEKTDSESPEELEKLIAKAKTALLVNQKYSLENDKNKYTLNVTQEASLKYVNFEEEQPQNLKVSFTNKGELSLFFTFFSDEEAKILRKYKFPFDVTMRVWEKGSSEDAATAISKEYIPGTGKKVCVIESFSAETAYCMKMRVEYNESCTQWSKEVEFLTPEFSKLCVWKECPGYDDDEKAYMLDKRNPRVATKVISNSDCTIIGSTYIPLNKVTSWSIKLLKSKGYDCGWGIFVGVAPFDINQNGYNHDKCGWYFYWGFSILWSGPPHKYQAKKYGPRKRDDRYARTRDSVGVVMDTQNGDLSFILNGVNYGVAFGGIPLNKPLVPCVILGSKGDSIELDTSEVEENADDYVPAPSDITEKSKTWDTITLTWDKDDDASFYQVEVDGSKSWDPSTTNTFTKGEFLPETEHSFRVRTAREDSVGEWSDVVKGRTLKAPEFPECVWNKCPDDVDNCRKYSVDRGNPRIAKKINESKGCDFSTIVGSTYIPPNKVTSWSVKILKSNKDNGKEIYIGLTPFDVDLDHYNFNHYGWYFDCYSSKLTSGPPHKYFWGKEYGPRKEDGQYVHEGDTIGVVMDMAKGELSFSLNRVNYGVAYEGIPLDKPLVPCVVFENSGDSVELDLSEVKENVSSSIPVLSSIATNSTTWDSITLTWDNISDATFYQIEVDRNKFWDAPTTNTFTKKGFLPETEHFFRVRTVGGSSVSEWSDVVKGRSLKAPEFSGCVWNKCPDDAIDERKYKVDGRNPRIAKKINGGKHDYCTVIGSTYVPLNKVTSWNIKILKSENSDGKEIFIGIAPFDVDQNYNYNHKKCGWFFDCYRSVLDSGPPHKYNGKEYGPRKGWGKYVRAGDSVGVVLDTTKGDLSFVLDEVNLGVAYGGIPLDKPLVPCVILGFNGSVELII